MIALLLIALAVVVGSQPPTPGKPEPGQEQQQKAADTTNQPAIQPRGSDEFPVVVRVLPAPLDPQKTQQEQDDRDSEAAAKRWNMVLAALTVAIGGLQFWMIRKQVKIAANQNTIIETQTEIMRLQERAASSSAIAAKTQTEHMLAGLAETKKTAEAAIVSANALKVIHRQWVNVEKWEWYVEPFIGKQQLTARIHVTNKTPLPITLVTVRCAFNGREGGYGSINEFIEPGGSGFGDTSSFLSEQQFQEYNRGNLQVAIAGWVHFRDAFGDMQNHPLGRFYTLGAGGVDHWRGLGGLHKNLRALAAKWPFNEAIEQRD